MEVEVVLGLLIADDDLLEPLDAATPDLAGHDEAKRVSCEVTNQRRAPQSPRKSCLVRLCSVP